MLFFSTSGTNLSLGASGRITFNLSSHRPHMSCCSDVITIFRQQNWEDVVLWEGKHDHALTLEFKIREVYSIARWPRCARHFTLIFIKSTTRTKSYIATQFPYVSCNSPTKTTWLRCVLQCRPPGLTRSSFRDPPSKYSKLGSRDRQDGANFLSQYDRPDYYRRWICHLQRRYRCVSPVFHQRLWI